MVAAGRAITAVKFHYVVPLRSPEICFGDAQQPS